MKKLTALAGLLLAFGMMNALPAHAEEPTEPTTEIICIEPYFHEYELKDLNMHTGDLLHLEFDSNGQTAVNLQLFDEDNHEIVWRYLYSNDENKVIYEYTAQDEYTSVRVVAMVHSDNDAELRNYYVRHNKMQVLDVVRLKKYLMNQGTLTRKQFSFYDRNQDGIVNIFDLLAVKRDVIPKGDVTVNAEIRLDSTKAVNPAIWKSALSDTSYVIQSPEELDEIITPYLKEAVVRSLEKTYDTDFFENNVLLLDFRAQDEDDSYQIDIGSVIDKGEQIHVTYRKLPIDGRTGTNSIFISQVAVPKSEYHGESVVWDEISINAKEPETRLDYEFESELLTNSNYTSDAKQLITSYDELTEFINHITSDENAEILAHYQEKYPETFFESKAVYLFVDSSAWDDYNIWRVSRDENQIIINQRTYYSSGCVIDDFLNQVVLNKSDIQNASFTVRNIGLYGESFDGDVLHFNADYADSLAVNFYQFRDEYQLDFYTGHYIGVNGYGYTLIGSFAYDGTENPFSGENSEIIYSAENHTVTVTYPNGKGETETHVLELPAN